MRPPGEVRAIATYHDACHLLHAQRIREAPLRVLAAIPGVDVHIVENADDETALLSAGVSDLSIRQLREYQNEQAPGDTESVRAEALALKVRAQLGLQDHTAALATLRRLLEQHPGSPFAHRTAPLQRVLEQRASTDQ